MQDLSCKLTTYKINNYETTTKQFSDIFSSMYMRVFMNYYSAEIEARKQKYAAVGEAVITAGRAMI